jgi:hypothetical protein
MFSQKNHLEGMIQTALLRNGKRGKISLTQGLHAVLRRYLCIIGTTILVCSQPYWEVMGNSRVLVNMY